MRASGAAPLLALIALAVGVAGCGGGGDTTTSDPLKITVPEGTPQTTTTQTTTTSTPSTTTQSPTTTQSTEQTTTTSPSKTYNPNKPDSQKNDIPPPANTPESKFEQYCNNNPGACG
jgi:hypothetical protein